MSYRRVNDYLTFGIIISPNLPHEGGVLPRMRLVAVYMHLLGWSMPRSPDPAGLNRDPSRAGRYLDGVWAGVRGRRRRISRNRARRLQACTAAGVFVPFLPCSGASRPAHVTGNVKIVTPFEEDHDRCRGHRRGRMRHRTCQPSGTKAATNRIFGRTRSQKDLKTL